MGACVLNAFAVLAVLRQLPPDVVDSNILQELSSADLRSLHKSSPEASELVRCCKSTLALSRQGLPAGGGAAIISTRAVAKVLAAYAAVSTLELKVKGADEALELMVIASCNTKICTARQPWPPLRCACFAAGGPACCMHAFLLAACARARSR